MALSIQALIPMALLLAGAAACRMPALRREAALIALVATAAAGGMTGLLLAQLAPAERLAIPYLHLFPSVDLGIEIDGLSLGMAVVTLATAFLLLLARLLTVGDRRQPWSAWLLTEAATLAVLMAGNLLLLYAFLQVVTLAATGALDEGSPRRRRFRLSLQLADLGLLLAGVEAVQAAGTSAIAGMPSDALGPVPFGLALLPAVVRAVTLGLTGEQGAAPVRIEPALVQAAPAGYLVLRLLAIAGGHPPTRLLQLALFAVGLALAAAFALAAWMEPTGRLPMARLLAVAGGAALAVSSLGTPLGTLAACWAWAVLVLLAGLTGISLRPGRPAGVLLPLSLVLIPPGILFVAVWMAAMSFAQDRLFIGLIPLAIIAVVTALPAAWTLRKLSGPLDVAAGWATGMLLLGSFPALGIFLVVEPAARVVRIIPPGTLRTAWWGLSTVSGVWPAALAVPLAGLIVVMVQRLGLRIDRGLEGRPWMAVPTVRRPRVSLPTGYTVLAAAVLVYLAALVVIVVR